MKKGMFILFTMGLNTLMAQTISVVANVNHVMCYGDNQASIDLQITGGAEPYTVIWSHGASGSTLNGLDGGAYFAQITDANGLSAYKVVHVDAPEMPLAITGISTNLSGFNTGDGAISAQVEGGTPFKAFSAPYILEWNNNVFGTLQQDGLSAGIYVLTATDNNGCSASKQFMLTQNFQMLPLEPQPETVGSLILSPNPSTGFVSVSPGKKPKKGYVIDNISGLLTPIDLSGDKIELDGLKNGFYTVVLEMQDGTIESTKLKVFN